MTLENLIFGRLTLESFPIMMLFENPDANAIVANAAGGIFILGAMIVVGLITKFRLWTPLWGDWLTSTDHKKIGIMYIVFSLVMLARGVAEGFAMRMQHALALDGGYLEAAHYAELFSTHGTIMICICFWIIWDCFWKSKMAPRAGFEPATK